MKKLHLLLCALALSASALAAELVLSTSTKSGGVTTTITVGRVQGEPAADGTLTLTVIPREVVTLADGTVVSDKFAAEWLSVPVPPAVLAALNTAIAEAKAAADAAKAATPAP